MTTLRLPKLYADDRAPSLIVPQFVERWRWTNIQQREIRAGVLVRFSSAQALFDEAYRSPHLFGIGGYFPYSIGDAIRELTGYQVIHDRATYWCERWEAWSSLEPDELRGRRLGLRPAYRSSYTGWYYKRDVVAAYLPRWTCEECGRKASPRDEWVQNWFQQDRISWRLGYTTHRIAIGSDGTSRSVTRYSRGHDDCTKRCSRFQASPSFAQFNDRERRKYWEHSHAPVCSPTCHEIVEGRYRRLTLDLWGKRKWVATGTQLLNEVRDKLPEKYRRNRKRSASLSVASSPPTTSATS